METQPMTIVLLFFDDSGRMNRGLASRRRAIVDNVSD
jgi:hypothetical protein